MKSVALLLLAARCAHGKEWVSVSEMPMRLSDMTATKIGMTSVMVVGGCKEHQLSCDDYDGCTYCPSISDRAFEYSSNDDRWRELTSLPRPRYRHAAAYDADVVYVVGGRHVDDAVVEEIDAYYVKTNTWSTLSGSLTVQRSDLAAFVYGGVLYAYGGYDAGYTAQSSATAIDVVSESYSSTSPPTLLEARGDFGIVVDGNTAYAAGGWTHLDWCSPLDTVESLDLSSADGWRSEPSLAVARGDKALALVDETLVVVGGEHNNGCSTPSTPVDDVEVLKGDKWKPIADAPEPKFRAAAVGLDGRLFFFGGQSAIETTCPEEAEFCFPVTNHTWVFDMDQDDGGDDDDNDGFDSEDAATVAAIALAVFIFLYVVASCIYCNCFSFGKKDKSAQNTSEIMLQKTYDHNAGESKTAV